MPRNIEVKVRIDSIAALLPRVRRLAEQGPWELRQDDTYFNCECGRLKLRMLAADAGELIYYCRARQAAPRESEYLRSPTASPDTLRTALARAYGERGRIRKRRLLFLRGRTRIHLDEVEQLGEFLELEVVLGAQESVAAATHEAQQLLRQLGIESAALIAGGYLELMEQAG
jgi:predicted adenylyl cyclase CyaB